MANLGPKQLSGIESRNGQIRIGSDADLLVLKADLSLRHAIARDRLAS
jgi:N-acetylglucosamine-6-phosphate deacetylase